MNIDTCCLSLDDVFMIKDFAVSDRFTRLEFANLGVAYNEASFNVLTAPGLHLVLNILLYLNIRS
jgi:hypothetical protein